MTIAQSAKYGRTVNSMKRFAKNVQREAKRNLTQGDQNVNKSLWNSVQGIVDVKQGNVVFNFNFYGEFQDEGVKGYAEQRKAPQSPYKYKKKMANYKAILNWVSARRFQFQERQTKQFMSYKSTAFLIARSIARTGVPATKWFSKPFYKYLDDFMDDFKFQYSLDLRDFIMEDFK